MPSSFALAPLPLLVAPGSLLAGAIACASVSGVKVDSRRVALRVSGLAAAFFAAIPLVLASSSVLRGATVLSGASRLFRIGSLDATVGFALDPTALAAAVAVLAVIVAACIGLTRRKDVEASDVGITLVAGAGALSAAIAEGFPTLLLGAAFAFWTARAFSRRAGGSGESSFASFGAATVFTALAVALMFWSLGGRWLDSTRYLSDYRARFVAESEGGDVKPPTASPNQRTPSADLLKVAAAKGTLTVVSHPGAKVYVGVAEESQLARSEPFGQTPFVRKEIQAGLQKIVIVPGGGAIVGGDGLEAALIDTVPIKDNTETVITLVGPTMTFHEITSQLTDPAELAGRRLGPIHVGTAIGVAAALAILALALAFRRALEGLEPSGYAAVASVVVAAGVLIARLGPLASASPWASGLGSLGLAVIAAHAAYRSGCVTTPMVALMGFAGLAGSPVSAVVCAAAFGPGVVALAFVRVREEAPRATPSKSKSKKRAKAKQAEPELREEVRTTPSMMVVLAAVAATPVPFFGAFVGISTALSKQIVSSVLGLLLTLAGTIAWGALAWSTGRALAGARSVPSVSVGIAAFGAAFAPIIALLVKPWLDAAGKGSAVSILIGVIPAAIAYFVYVSARRSTVDPAPEAVTGHGGWWGHASRVVALVDSIATLPLSWIDAVFARKPEAPSAEEP